MAPYRGDRELARHATAAAYPDALVQGGEGALPVIWDFAPHLSPLKSHWVYAWLSATGRLAQGGSANTTEPLFGVRVDADAATLRPSRVEDVAFRHWWWRYGSDLFGWPQWPVLLLVGGALLGGVLAFRSLVRAGEAVCHSAGAAPRAG
jgi:hypothetical protein